MESAFFPMMLSLKVSLIATLFVIIIGCACAYILSQKTFRGMEIIDVLLTMPLVMPPTVTGYLLVVLLGTRGVVGRHLYDLSGYSIIFTWHAAVLCSFIVSLPFMVKTARAAFESVDRNLVLASYTMGYSELGTFFRIVLPLARKGVLAGAILSFARSMGEFGATLMLAGNIPGKTDTMPIAIYAHAAAGEWDRALDMVLLFTCISALFIYLANRLTRKQKWAWK